MICTTCITAEGEALDAEIFNRLIRLVSVSVPYSTRP